MEQIKWFTNSSPEQRQNPYNAKSNTEVRVFQAIPMLGSGTNDRGDGSCQPMWTQSATGAGTLQWREGSSAAFQTEATLQGISPQNSSQSLYCNLCVVKNIGGYPRINIGNDMETRQQTQPICTMR